MSVTTSVLAIVGIGCLLVLTALFAVLGAAARDDAQLERHARMESVKPVSSPVQSEVSPAGAAEDLEEAGERRPSGRFARRTRDRMADAQDRPLVR